jgi:hypothetical protein
LHFADVSRPWIADQCAHGFRRDGVYPTLGYEVSILPRVGVVEVPTSCSGRWRSSLLCLPRQKSRFKLTHRKEADNDIASQAARACFCGAALVSIAGKIAFEKVMNLPAKDAGALNRPITVSRPRIKSASVRMRLLLV